MTISLGILGAVLVTLLQCTDAGARPPDGAPTISVTHVDSALVANLHEGDVVWLDLGPAGRVGAKTRTVQLSQSGRIVWSGTLLCSAPRPGDATLVFAGDRITGSVRTGDGKLYRISPTATGNKVELVDPATMGAD